MTAQDVSTTITEVQATADTILTVIGNTAPAVAGEAALSEEVLNLIAELASKALAAWSASSGIAITPESVAALMPNTTPLSSPDAA